MKSQRLVRQFACIVASVVGFGLLANQAQAVNEYFDINGTGTGSGAASGGSYTFEASTGTGGWNTTSTGITTATTAWPDGNNFMRFSAGTDTAAKNFTVTANSNHTFAGMALQTNGGGTVTIASAGGAVMNMFSSANGQGFFVGGVAAQQLMITAPIGGDATTPLVWQGVLSGTAGSLFLYGNNTFQGGVQLNSSAGLNFNNANSFGNGGTIVWGAAASAGTSFTVAAPALAADITIANPMLAKNPTGTGATSNLTIGNLNNHKVTWSGGLSLVTGVASSITANSGVVTELSGVVSGTDSTKAFTKAGVGTLILSNAGNSYAGQTTIGNGILSVPGIGNSGSNSPLGKNGTINLGATTTAGNLTYTGSGETSGKVLNLAGTTGGGTVDQSGTGLLKFTANLTATGVGIKTLTLTGSTAGTGEIAGAIVDNDAANKTSLSKSGAGTWTLSGASTYQGGTTISGGTLKANNTSGSATGTGAVAVNSGGTLAGAGAISGPVSINNGGKLSPGNSLESLAVGALSFTAGSTFVYEINSNASFAAGADLVNVALTGAVTIDPTTVLSANDVAVTPVVFNGAKFTLISYDKNVGLTGTFAGLSQGSTVTIGLTNFTIDYADTSPGFNFDAPAAGGSFNYVTLTAVPEASTVLFGGLVASTIGVFHVRRKALGRRVVT